MTDKNPNISFLDLFETTKQLEEEVTSAARIALDELPEESRKALLAAEEKYGDSIHLDTDELGEELEVSWMGEGDPPDDLDKLPGIEWERRESEYGGKEWVGVITVESRTNEAGKGKKEPVNEGVRQKRTWYPDGKVEEEVEWDEDHHLAAMAAGEKLPEGLVKENAEELIAKFVQSEAKEENGKYTVMYGGETYTGESVDDLIEQLTSKGPDEPEESLDYA